MEKAGKRLAILIAFTLSLLSLTLVSADSKNEIYSYSGMTLNMSVTNSINLNFAGQITATLFLVPQDDERQKILSLNKFSYPEAGIKEKEDSIVYAWLSASSAEFGINSLIKTSVIMPKSTIAPFPQKITENLAFTAETEHIDITSEITAKANEIAAGKTDMMRVVTDLADWVYVNMVYDEAYKDVIEKSSSVFKIKRGVCDEYTNLFISLCRSLGIPARFVSGVVYSNIKEEFGNHAWAEVYIPGHGWVPFDPTYAQYGFIDSTHISFSKSAESPSSIYYSYTGGTIIKKGVSIITNIVSKDAQFSPKTSMEISLLKNSVKAGSYVPLEVMIRNNLGGYLPLSVYVTKSPGIEGKNTKSAMLLPHEERLLFFVIKTPDDESIEDGYSYEAQIEVGDIYNNQANTVLTFSKNYDDYMSLEEARSIVDALSKSEINNIYNVDLICKGKQSEFYEDEEIKASCTVSNNGNTPINNLNVCIKQDCKEISLAIGKSETKEFVLRTDKDYLASAKNSVIDKAAYFSINLLKKPDLKILDISKKEIDYYKDSINLTIETKSVCRNFTASAGNLKISADDVELKKNIALDFSGSGALNEKLKVRAKCYDLRNNEYSDEQTFDIQITNMPFYAKILQFFAKLFG